jgi:hypothetical protein
MTAFRRQVSRHCPSVKSCQLGKALHLNRRANADVVALRFKCKLAGDLDGWVTHLVRELERRISGQIGRKECVHFKIGHQLSGHEQLDEQIRTAIRESSIFLLIGSNGYLASDWCMNQEFPQFLGDFGGERIFIVEKMPYNRAALPRPVANRVGNTFWEEDRIKGEWRTFGDPVATALTDVKYQERINRLSQEMAALLLATPKPNKGVDQLPRT